ncbi:uncharacterized protein SAPINGB_P001824 [Magnusiomyces paraingens]|uniref:Iron-sulfur assembly protein 1 n=1 Tax=Magnusiomyces paraingens TaxID=2606893 RepID=A0A5E8BBE1_9ASCO|nr:uncharacterized protein SAPINGB_P001824 [Saprochaete ingens]VVT48531.1 unnamed protein product [Saprochaete ingens]
MRQSQVTLALGRSTKRFMQTIQQQPSVVMTPLVFSNNKSSASATSSDASAQTDSLASAGKKWTTYSLPRVSQPAKPISFAPLKKTAASTPFKLSTPSSQPISQKSIPTTNTSTNTSTTTSTISSPAQSVNTTNTEPLINASTTTTTTTTTPAHAPAPAPAAKPRRKLRPRKAAITLSSTAVEHLRNLLNQPNPQMIRIGVRNRGCSGLTYHLEYVDQPGKFDEEVIQDGVKVLIDSKALFSIIGSQMDWIDDKLSSRFVFHNPNSKGECGCGESFMV